MDFQKDIRLFKKKRRELWMNIPGLFGPVKKLKYRHLSILLYISPNQISNNLDRKFYDWRASDLKDTEWSLASLIYISKQLPGLLSTALELTTC